MLNLSFLKVSSEGVEMSKFFAKRKAVDFSDSEAYTECPNHN